jgi:hypothetical protein
MVELELVEERVDRLSRLEIEPTSVVGSEIATLARKLWPPDGVCATWAKNHGSLVADTKSEDSPY